MVNAPLISVIIPVYNHSRELMRTLASLITQSYRPLEIIIVNDGSTDAFENFARQIQNRANRQDFSIKIINQKNLGAPAARNRGFRESTGEYVIFWDADTLAMSCFISKLKEALDNHPEASYAYSKFKFGWKTMRSQKFCVDDLKRYNYIDTTSLIRRSALPARPFDESLKRLQDWDLWLTLLEQNKTGTFVPEVLFKKIVGNRQGISQWLPSFAYRLLPFLKSARNYNVARRLVLRKHGLISG